MAEKENGPAAGTPKGTAGDGKSGGKSQQSASPGNGIPQGLEQKFRAQLEDALEDAHLLVWYASRDAVKVDDSVVTAIVVALDSYGTPKWKPATEASFWTNLGKLSEAVLPVTAESIKSTSGMGGPAPVDAKRAVKRYTISAISVLVLLLFVQIYWLWGSNLSSQIQASEDRIFQTKEEISSSRLHIQFLTGTTDKLFTEIMSSTGDASDGESSNIEQINSLEQETISLRSKIESLNEIRRSEEQKLVSSHIILQKWNVIYNLIHDERDAYQPFSLIFFVQDESSDLVKKQESREAVNDLVSLTSAQSTLGTLSSYILPLLYGLLGSLAYILRSLARSIRSMTFSPTTNIRYRLRWPLGMLAGITVGFFFEPGALPAGLSALQPLALAFLAGYSVELVFTGLDKLVNTFTEEKGAKAAA